MKKLPLLGLTALLLAWGVAQANQTPVANAGPDLTMTEGTSIMLDGSGSFDPDGDTLLYNWSQIAGSVSVPISNTPLVQTTITAPPSVPLGRVTITYELLVFDGELISTDTVNVDIRNVNNNAPVASASAPSPVATGGTVVTLNGASSFDGDGDPLTYSWSQLPGSPVPVAITDDTSVQATLPYPLKTADNGLESLTQGNTEHEHSAGTT